MVVVTSRWWALAFVLLGGCEFGAMGNGSADGTSLATTSGSSGMPDAVPTTGGPGVTSSADSTAAVDTTSSSPASSDDGESSTDTGDLPPPLPTGPFGPPEPLAFAADPVWGEDDPVLSPDGLELYFESTRDTGYGDIWVARRVDLDADWGEPVLVPGIGAPGINDGTPGLTDDGLGMYFVSHRQGTIGFNDVYLTERADLRSPWGAPARVDALASTLDELAPHPIPGTKALFLCSNRLDASAAGGGYDVYRADAEGERGELSTPVIVPQLSTISDDCMAAMRSDRLEVVFDSNRLPSTGLYDLWSATRALEDDAFSEPFPLENVNSLANDRDPFVSPDGHELYFSSDRTGNDNLYMATR